jgi:TPR repeat protein
VAAAGFPAAADWYTRAANAVDAASAVDLCIMYTAGPVR